MQELGISAGGARKSSKALGKGLSVSRWLSELFGCQHKDMSRPFSRQGETYRVCINCGARRQFVETTWETRGPYYFAGAQPAELFKTEGRARNLGRRVKIVKKVA